MYFTIDNRHGQSDTLIAAQSDIGMAMLMTSAATAACVMQMRVLPQGIAVVAGTSHALAPAGDHVMLSGVVGEYRTGDKITLTVTFAGAGDVTLTVPVDNTRRTPPGAGPTEFDAQSGESSTQGGLNLRPDALAITAAQTAMFALPEAVVTAAAVVVTRDKGLGGHGAGRSCRTGAAGASG